jgi:uncharacterized protein YqhQ
MTRFWNTLKAKYFINYDKLRAMATPRKIDGNIKLLLFTIYIYICSVSEQISNPYEIPTITITDMYF